MATVCGKFKFVDVAGKARSHSELSLSEKHGGAFFTATSQHLGNFKNACIVGTLLLLLRRTFPAALAKIARSLIKKQIKFLKLTDRFDFSAHHFLLLSKQTTTSLLFITVIYIVT